MKVMHLLSSAVSVTLPDIITVKAYSTPEVSFDVKTGVNFSKLKTCLGAITNKSGKIGFNTGVL